MKDVPDNVRAFSEKADHPKEPPINPSEEETEVHLVLYLNVTSAILPALLTKD